MKNSLLDLFNIIQNHFIQNLILQPLTVANNYMRNLFPKILQFYFVFYIQLRSFISVVLHKLFLCHFDGVWIIGLFRKESLSILNWFLEILKNLFIWIYHHFVIKMEFKGHLGDHPQIQGQISMIASHTIQHSNQLNSHLSNLNHPEHFFNLDLNRICHKLLLQNCIEKYRSILFQHGVGMGLFLIEFYPEKLP